MKLQVVVETSIQTEDLRILVWIACDNSMDYVHAEYQLHNVTMKVERKGSIHSHNLAPQKTIIQGEPEQALNK